MIRKEVDEKGEIHLHVSSDESPEAVALVALVDVMRLGAWLEDEYPKATAEERLYAAAQTVMLRARNGTLMTGLLQRLCMPVTSSEKPSKPELRLVESPNVHDRIAALITAAASANARLLEGNKAPSDSVGADGDFYIDLNAQAFSGPKTNGKWPAGMRICGPEFIHTVLGPTGGGER